MKHLSKHLSKHLPLATAICFVLLLLLLAMHCIDIYFFQDSASAQIFAYDDVASRLQSLVPLLIACTLLSILSLVFPSSEEKKLHVKHVTCQHQEDYAKSSINERPLVFIRTILLLIAVGFISWGVFNGGLYDVLVKAINICTECIGLG